MNHVNFITLIKKTTKTTNQNFTKTQKSQEKNQLTNQKTNKQTKNSHFRQFYTIQSKKEYLLCFFCERNISNNKWILKHK